MRRLLNRTKTFALLILIVASMGLSSVFAQSTERVLLAGQTTLGVIDQNNAARVFVYTGRRDETIDVSLSTDSALTLIITDSSGALLGQALGEAGVAEISVPSLTLANAGQIYITVFPSAGADVSLPAEFSITLNSDNLGETEAETPVAPETTSTSSFEPGRQISLPQGVQINLRWDTIDDLNLQVRDPNGGTLFWGARSTANGGTFGIDRNGLCENVIDPPSAQTVETAEWAGGGVFVGSYELLIYYRTFCGGSTTVDFTVDVTVNGTPLDPIQGTLLAPAGDDATVYIASFSINAEGEGTVNASGPYTDTRELPLPAQTLLDTPAVPLSLDVPVQSVITNENYYRTFSFEGLANQIIGVNMTAINGSLDPLLLVLNSSGNIIGANDDIVPAENTNSAISALILPADDLYTVVATRYGKDVGGTEGEFEIQVSGSNVPQDLLSLDLPTGNIQVFLQWDTNADLQLLVRDPFGDTVFNDSTTIRSGGRLIETGNINCTSTADVAPPIYYTYWPENTFLNPGAYEVEVQYRSECGDSRPVVFTVSIVVDGELIYTNSASIAFNERFVTSFTIDGATGAVAAGEGGIVGGSETIPWQSALPSATVLAATDSRTGSITPQDKFDLYVFEGQAGDVVTISMSRTSGNLDTLLYLIDPNNIELASNDDVNQSTDSLISVTLQEDGRYTIIATHFAGQFGGTVGGYNLSLRAER